jgi:hypothetical protein
MNSNDPFEDQLRRQAFRSVPPEWKKSMIPAHIEGDCGPFWLQFWNSFLFPCRHAYTVLALLWIGIAFLKADTPALAQDRPHSASSSESSILSGWQEKQHYLMVARSNPAALEYIIR